MEQPLKRLLSTLDTNALNASLRYMGKANEKHINPSTQPGLPTLFLGKVKSCSDICTRADTPLGCVKVPTYRN